VQFHHVLKKNKIGRKKFPSVNSTNFSNFIVKFRPKFLTPKKYGAEKKKKTKRTSINV
jgi:hypothetical protein